MKHAALFAAIKTLWDDSTLPDVIPGGIHEGRAPQDLTDEIYAVCTVKENEHFESSGGSVTYYDLSIRVYSRSGPTAVGAIEDALAAEIDWQQAALVVVGATKCVCIQPDPGSLDKDPDTKEAADVEVCSAAWTVGLQLAT